jgi:hypothetical protein
MPILNKEQRKEYNRQYYLKNKKKIDKQIEENKPKIYFKYNDSHDAYYSNMIIPKNKL